jgi:hypothetical protein
VTTDRLTDQQLDEIAIHVGVYEKSHDHPREFPCCSAHAVADQAPALVAEVRRHRGQIRYLLGQLAKRDAETGRGDKALREFLTGEPEPQPDVTKLVAENGRLRAELAAEQAQHAFTLRQRNNRAERLNYLRDLAKSGQSGLLVEEALNTLAASIGDHQPADTDEMAASLRRDGFGDDEIADMLGPGDERQPDPRDALLRDVEAHLSALHGSVARHDNLAANLGCSGCELRDQIRAALREA